MEDNEKKIEEVVEESEIKEESSVPFTVVENTDETKESISEEETASSDAEKVDGEEIPPINPEMENGDGLAGMLGSILGGGGSPDYSEVFKQITEILERINSDLDKVDTNVVVVNDDLEKTKAELAATKLYTKMLTKMIVATDIVFAIAIILILIFK